LIGIIHEWRKVHNAALQSYEAAFEMEESLPADNHSVVRLLLCDRLEIMCKKLNNKDKLKEYQLRITMIRR
jgi:CRISPR/Cas system-associated exonuclease Cas4 (RecB family)